VALSSTVFVFLTALYFGLLEDEGSFSFEDINYIFYFFLQSLSYCWLAVLLSTLFKRSGISITVFFLYTIVLENVVVQWLNYRFDGAGKYLPIQSSDELMPLPILEKLQKEMTNQEINTTVQLSLVIAYLVAWFLLSKRKFETADL
jgi:ABC-2 type transport system permease protein